MHHFLSCFVFSLNEIYLKTPIIAYFAKKVLQGEGKVSQGEGKVSHGAGKVSHGAVKVSHCARKVSHGAVRCPMVP